MMWMPGDVGTTAVDLVEANAEGNKCNPSGNGGGINVIDGNKIDLELYPKHPLQHDWTMWFYKNDRTKSWEDNQNSVINFQTVEDFWALYNHIEVASKVNPGCDYSLFKSGIKPMWEDHHNKNGGRWIINLDKKQRSNMLDNFWLEVMLCMIGEAFGDNGKYVNGAVVSIRAKGDKIGIWLNDAKEIDAIMDIGRKIKNRLNIDNNVKLSFEAHEDSMKKSSSINTKSLFHV